MNGPISPPTDRTDLQAERQIQRLTAEARTGRHRSDGGWPAGVGSERPDANGIPWPLRRVLEWETRAGRKGTFGRRGCRGPFRQASPACPASMVKSAWAMASIRRRGPRAWKIRGRKSAASDPRPDQGLAENRHGRTRALKVDSDPVRWAGVRLIDLAAKFGMATRNGQQLDLQRPSSTCFPVCSSVHA